VFAQLPDTLSVVPLMAILAVGIDRLKIKRE
jgi:hypothetical protein